MSDDISNLMFEAIEKGDYDTVEQYVNTYGLNHYTAWEGGYALLKHSLEKEQREISLYLLMKDIKVNFVDRLKKDKTPLHIAIEKNDMEIIQKLLDKGADVNARDENNRRPLYFAVHNKNMIVTQMVIEKGAKIKITWFGEYDINYLHIAVNNKHMEMVQMLLDKGANINGYDEDKKTPLFVALMSKNLEIVELLLNKGAVLDPSHTSKKDKGKLSNSLLIAVQNKDFNVVQMLLNRGFNVQACNNTRDTALHMAAKTGDMKIAELLLNRGGDVNTCNNIKETPLHNAVNYKHMEMVQLLLNKGADVNACNNKKGTPLHLAVANKQPEMIEILLNKGADVNACNKTQDTPLHVSVKSVDVEIVQLLLNKGAKVDALNRNNITPFQIAVKIGNVEIVQLLLNKGADINSEKSTVLHLAVENKRIKIVEMLLANGADVNACNSKKGTPLHLAVENKQLEMIEILLNKGADVNACNNTQDTPLHTAAKSNILEIVNVLLSNGANINSCNNTNETPLFIAIKNIKSKSIDVVQTLFDKGADINLCNTNGDTLLHYAVRSKSIDVVEILLKKGANITARNNSEFSPLDIAIRNGHIDLVQILVEKGADVNACGTNNKTPLKFAIQLKTAKIVSYLLTNGASIEYPSEESSYLHDAVNSCGDVKKNVELILNKGHNVNCVDSEGRTPFYCGVDKGNTKCLAVLLKYGANVNISDNMGKMPIHVAVEKGDDVYVKKKKRNSVSHTNNGKHIKLIEYLLNQGALVNAKITHGNDEGLTPLFLAIREWKTFENVVKILLSYGANPNIDVNGMTAFHKYVKQAKTNSDTSSSTYYGNNKEIQVIKMLFQHGANLNAVDNEGISVADELLHLAVRVKDIELIKLVLDNGANSNYADVDGITALHKHIEKMKPIKPRYEDESNLEIVKLLLQHGATTLNAVDSEGISVADEFLHLAACYKDLELIRLLLDHGANSGYADVDGMTALHFLLSNDYSTYKRLPREDLTIDNITRLLLEHGSCVNAQNKWGRSPLHIMCYLSEQNNVTVANILLQFGAKLDLKDKEGNTPLHLATKRSCDTMVLFLLEHMANRFVKNVAGRTPHDLISSSQILTYFFYHDMHNEENSKIVTRYTAYRSYNSFDSLLKPVVMAKHLGHCFDKENKVINGALRYDTDILMIFETECKEEVDRMKEEKIGDSNVNYYEFLRKSTHQLAVCLNNEFIMNTLKQADYRTAYPMYADVINGHFTRGKFRKQLLDKVYERWNLLFPTLTDDCAQILLAYLNNEDLEVVITAFTH